MAVGTNDLLDEWDKIRLDNLLLVAIPVDTSPGPIAPFVFLYMWLPNTLQLSALRPPSIFIITPRMCLEKGIKIGPISAGQIGFSGFLLILSLLVKDNTGSLAIYSIITPEHELRKRTEARFDVIRMIGFLFYACNPYLTSALPSANCYLIVEDYLMFLAA